MHEFKSMQKCTLQQINRDVKAQEASQKVRKIYQRAKISSHESVSDADDPNFPFTLMFWKGK